MMGRSRILLLLFLVTLTACRQPLPKENKSDDREGWKAAVERQLPLLGHRNWILIVDKAYPAPSNPDITLINTGASMIDVVRDVDSLLQGQGHIRPIIYQDAEFQYLDEGLASGITTYRKDIKALWGARTVREISHEEIFRKIDTASQLFKVVVLKTESLLPYTSVFLELDCGYWDGKKEETLRSRIKKIL
jgi:L-fucose mutarotase/ribose pyranase (RbsD/FucU family)